MATMHEEVKATLESAGMKHIVRALRAHHKAAYRKYRNCGSVEQMLNLQTVQKVIDTTLPQIIEGLMNSHIPEPAIKGAPKRKEWSFADWIARIPFRWHR